MAVGVRDTGRRRPRVPQDPEGEPVSTTPATALATDPALLSSSQSVTTPARGRRIPWADVVGAFVVIVVVLLTWAPRLTGPIDPRSDAGVYYILGTSLYEGKGYRLLNEPGEIQAVQYPPLLPAIVATHQWALGTSDF